MTDSNHSEITFADLDSMMGIPDSPPPGGGEFPLPAWYRKVRTSPLSTLTLEDICKACRQKIHLEHVIPMALCHLEKNPTAGEFYDGELVCSLNAIPMKYWNAHSEDRTRLKAIIARIQSSDLGIDEIQAEFRELLRRLSVTSTG